jgi:metal-sulfur cluster biosynthetic enzyme
MVSERELYLALTEVDDPEIGVNIVDLGLIYGLSIGPDGDISVEMTLTNPSCPMRRTIGQLVGKAIERLPGVRRVDVRFVWSPRWTPERLSPAARRRLGFS